MPTLISNTGTVYLGMGLKDLCSAMFDYMKSSQMDKDSNSSNLKPAGANTLTGVAMVLKEYPKTLVNVVGYTDSTGSNATNQRLSQQRAESVSSALITQGVDANRLCTTGAGPSNPIASNDTPEGRAQNRRVEITLSPLQ